MFLRLVYVAVTSPGIYFRKLQATNVYIEFAPDDDIREQIREGHEGDCSNRVQNQGGLSFPRKPQQR